MLLPLLELVQDAKASIDELMNDAARQFVEQLLVVSAQLLLDNLALIHMNGRVQDPVIGRFLSADPFVPAPFDPQSFNRFSYVRNNTLTLTDPSGFRDAPAEWVCIYDCTAIGTVAISDAAAQALFASGRAVPGGGFGADFWSEVSPASSASAGTVVSGGSSNESRRPPTAHGDAGGSSLRPTTASPGNQPQGEQEKEPEQACTNGPSYMDRYVDFVSDNAINVGPYAVALLGGLWPKSWAPATSGRPPLLGSTNPLTSVPRAFGVPGADSALARTGAAGIGLLTVGVGFYDVTIELSEFAYAIPSYGNGSCPE